MIDRDLLIQIFGFHQAKVIGGIRYKVIIIAHRSIIGIIAAVVVIFISGGVIVYNPIG